MNKYNVWGILSVVSLGVIGFYLFRGQPAGVYLPIIFAFVTFVVPLVLFACYIPIILWEALRDYFEKIQTEQYSGKVKRKIIRK